jgi:hypothetical protein
MRSLCEPCAAISNSQYSISSLSAYDNTGNPYDVQRVLTPDLASLNVTAYNEYSPLYIPIAFAMSYGLSFLSITGKVSLAFQFCGLRTNVRFLARQLLLHMVCV